MRQNVAGKGSAITYPIPANEDARVAALREYAILDTETDPVYETFATLAAAICETPIALVSLVDSSRQWFKANVGLPGVTETPREVSFCTHAVAAHEMLEVRDATADPRFAENPLVLGEPSIRFYAGAPLIDHAGNAIGTICAIDREPKILTSRQREALSGVAAALVKLIEARRGVSLQTLEQNALLHGALQFAPLPMVLMRVPERPGAPPIISFVNRAFTDLFGYSMADIVGRPPGILHGPRTDLTRIARLQAAAEEREAGTEVVVFATASGSSRTVEVRSRQINDAYRIVSYRDLTRLHETQEALSNANERLHSLLTHNNDAVLTVDRRGGCLDVNASAIKLFGFARKDLLGFEFGRSLGRGIFPDDDPFPQTLLAGKPLEFAARFLHSDGRTLEIECKAIPMMVGVVTEGAYVIAKDVTERRRLTDLVTEQANRTHALYLISATKARAESDQIDAAIRLATESFSMEVGYVGELRGDTLSITNRTGFKLFDPGYSIGLANTLVAEAVAQNDVLAVSDINDSSIEFPTKTAYPGWHGYIAAPLSVEGKITGVIGILARRVIDFSEFDRQFMRLVAALVSTLLERQAQQQRLDRLAFYDQLTGLPNRAKFMSALGDAVVAGRAGEHVFALHCIDLDGFKALNDGAGHSVGDLALEEVGVRLRGILRPYDLPARLGGDEFVLLQGGVARRSDCIALGNRIVKLLSEPYVLDGVTYRLSASVGVALFAEDGDDAKALLRNADAALYRAKQSGKGRAEFATPQ